MKSFYLKSMPRVNEDGELVLPVSNIPMARQWVLDCKDARKYVCEVKEYHERRSLDANAYFWKLADELAQAVGSTKEEVYREAIRNVGVWKDFKLEVDAVKTFCCMWNRGGTGWVTEQLDYADGGEKIIVRAYYGSSEYNKKQMSRLIDNIVQDCKAVGIETLTPEELERLKEEWHG